METLHAQTFSTCGHRRRSSALSRDCPSMAHPFVYLNPRRSAVYIVLDDFGRNGRAYRETDVERADLEAKKPRPGRRLQHRREMVGGCIGRRGARIAPPLRSANARRAFLPRRICRAARRAIPRHAATAAHASGVSGAISSAKATDRRHQGQLPRRKNYRPSSIR
jgi:hypothetical protein